MPSQRAPGQKAVIVVMKDDFLTAIDSNLESMGFSDRSQFIRTAVLEKLDKKGIRVEESESVAPSRAGKGGRKKKPVPYDDGVQPDQVMAAEHPPEDPPEDPPEAKEKTNIKPKGKKKTS